MSAIRDFPLPRSKHKLREFLGLINSYHRFIPHCAQLLHLLHALLSHTQTDNKLQWSDDSIAAFEQANAALTDATLLSHPKPDAVVAIMSDASDFAVGAVLQQVADGQWQPIAYFFRKLSPTEHRCSTYDRIVGYVFVIKALSLFLLKVVLSLYILTTNLSLFL